MKPAVRPGPRLSRVLRGAGNVALTLAAVLGVASVLLVVVGGLFGFKPVIVRSGSMEPTLPTGALALTRTVEASRIGVGDVISVTRGDATVTHRVVSIERKTSPGQAPLFSVQLKGDANTAPDPTADAIDQAPRVVGHVPWLGRAIAWLSTPPGIYVLALYLALCVGIVVRGGSPDSGATEAEGAVTTAGQATVPGRRRRDVPTDSGTLAPPHPESGPDPDQR